MPLFTRPQAQAATDANQLQNNLKNIQKRWSDGLPEVAARAANGQAPAVEEQAAETAAAYQAGFLPEAASKIAAILRINNAETTELAALMAAINAVAIPTS